MCDFIAGGSAVKLFARFVSSFFFVQCCYFSQLSIKIVEFCRTVATKENEKRFLLICFSLYDYILDRNREKAAIKTERKSFIKWNRCRFFLYPGKRQEKCQNNCLIFCISCDQRRIHYLQTFSFFCRLPKQNGNGEVFSSASKFNRNLSSMLVFGVLCFLLLFGLLFSNFLSQFILC